jgi:hypothetical protein
MIVFHQEMNMTPEQQTVVDAVIERAEQACRYVLKHNEEAWSGDERTAYHQGFEAACEICVRAIRSHVMTHIAGDILTQKND